MADPITVRLDKTVLDRITRNLPGGANTIVGQIAHEIQGDAQTSFGSGPDGQTYKRGNVTHVASSAQYPPNTDTGNLTNSAFTKQVRVGTWQVGFMAAYSAALEFGTPHIAPRPYLYPAVFKASKDFGRKFRGLFR